MAGREWLNCCTDEIQSAADWGWSVMLHEVTLWVTNKPQHRMLLQGTHGVKWEFFLLFCVQHLFITLKHVSVKTTFNPPMFIHSYVLGSVSFSIEFVNENLNISDFIILHANDKVRQLMEICVWHLHLTRYMPGNLSEWEINTSQMLANVGCSWISHLLFFFWQVASHH